jgi:hypothetical protein
METFGLVVHQDYIGHYFKEQDKTLKNCQGETELVQDVGLVLVSVRIISHRIKFVFK